MTLVLGVDLGTSVCDCTLPCLPGFVETTVLSLPSTGISCLCSNNAHSDLGVSFRLPWWPTL